MLVAAASRTMRLRAGALAVTGFALGVLAGGAIAVPPGPGSLDPTFGVAGVIAGLPFAPVAILPQGDGKLVIVGSSIPAFGSSSIELARYYPDGALDPTFGQGGIVRSLRDARATSALRQPDGSIVVSGELGDTPPLPPVLLRFQGDGAPDTSFGVNGVVTPAFVVDGYAFQSRTVLLQPDRKLLLAGFAQSAVVVRYLPDGTLDTSFGDNGLAKQPANSPSVYLPPVAALHADGSIVVGGSVFVVRFDTRGVFNARFGADGVATVPFGVTALVPQAGGKLIVAGTVAGGGPYSGPGLRYDRVLLRVTADGEVDTTFGSGGKVITGVGGFRSNASARIDPWPADKTATVLAQSDGQLIAIATAVPGQDGAFAAIVTRHDGNDGALDITFGQAGKSAPARGSTILGAAAIEPGGKVIIGVSAGSALARYVISGPYTTTSLRSDRAFVAVDETVMLTAAVVGNAPSGTVRFVADGATIAGCDASVIAAASTAACAATLLGHTPEPIAISAEYSGDTVNPASTSPDYLQQTKAPASGAAIEFLHATLGDYFLTSAPAEIAKLDAGVLPGWLRTGQFFLLFAEGTAEAKAMCRFFSSERAAPASVHFYTPFADECSSLRASADWIYEGDVLPVKVTATGICPAGSLPLFRSSNGGRDGVPRHRLTVDRRVRVEMLLQGWTQEGNGSAAVAMCARATR